MKKMRNSKRGFTLTEILIVTAIVVIVSAAAFAGVAITLSRARDTQKNLKENNGDNFEVAARSEVDAINEDAADFAEIPSYKPKDSESSEETSEDETTESTGGGDLNGNTPTPLPTNTPTPKPTATPLPTATPKPANGGSGAVVFSGNTVTRGTEGSGVMSIDQNSDGSTTIGLLYNQWNDGSVQVWKNQNGTYDIKGLNNGGNVIGNALNSTGVTFDWNPINQNQRFTLSDDQVTALESVYGIKFN